MIHVLHMEVKKHNITDVWYNTCTQPQRFVERTTEGGSEPPLEVTEVDSLCMSTGGGSEVLATGQRYCNVDYVYNICKEPYIT